MEVFKNILLKFVKFLKNFNNTIFSQALNK